MLITLASPILYPDKCEAGLPRAEESCTDIHPIHVSGIYRDCREFCVQVFAESEEHRQLEEMQDRLSETQPCWVCSGEMAIYSGGDRHECPRCEGLGRLPMGLRR